MGKLSHCQAMWFLIGPNIRQRVGLAGRGESGNVFHSGKSIATSPSPPPLTSFRCYEVLIYIVLIESWYMQSYTVQENLEQCRSYGRWTDKKENQAFLIYQEIQNGAVAKSYMTNGLLIYGEIFTHFLIYEEALPHIWLCNCCTLNFLIYEENFLFFFIRMGATTTFNMLDTTEAGIVENWRGTTSCPA